MTDEEAPKKKRGRQTEPAIDPATALAEDTLTPVSIDEIKASALTFDHINVGTPTPTDIDATAITANKLTATDTETAIEILLNTLGIDPRDLKGLQILAEGTIRTYRIDNSMRSKKFTALPRYERDAQGRIIE